MFLHQISNTVGDTIVNAYLYDGWSWVQHMHKAFEFSFVLDGSIEATAGDRQYTLGAGDGLLALPFQLHALRIPAGARVLVVVFSASHVPAFPHAPTEKRRTMLSYGCPMPPRNILSPRFSAGQYRRRYRQNNASPCRSRTRSASKRACTPYAPSLPKARTFRRGRAIPS